MRYKPMLAYNANKKPITPEEWKKGIYVQPKLDGVRCLIQYEKVKPTGIPPNIYSHEVKAYSRTAKEWKNINHILKQLKPFFKKYPDIVLDGELYNHELKDNFEKIISLVRKTKPTDEDRVESAEKVQFHCYDIVTPINAMGFYDRNYFIKKHLNGRFPSVKTLPYGEVFSLEEAEEYHFTIMTKGYEGSILRKNARYECKRSYTLQKVKDFSDAEAMIVGYEEGKGKRTGTLGKFLMQDDDGNQFGCPPGKGHNYQDLRDILKDIHKYMGQRATFTYFERTKAGSYRHPHYKSVRNYE